jgi:hypothetical protein
MYHGLPAREDTARPLGKAAKRAEALSAICQYYLDHKQAQKAREQLQQFFGSK